MLTYKEAAHKLSSNTYIVLNWFKVNSMVANPGKFQMFLGSKIDNSMITFAIENKQIKCKREVKLLGITIDEKLTFTRHIANICSLANNRLRALTRIKAEANQSNISSNIAFFPCWMKCWIGFANRKICEKIENRVG